MVKTKKQIIQLMNDYNELKEILAEVELEINDTFVEVVKSTLQWVLDEDDED